ncbi:MAG TPA: NADH-quinone oxidoreductase subunit N [Acidobacteriaceae bacterium]|nr:NADH-quinone oxidoreductase subunit N [Acidobacteriaceae bacterium]
MNSLPPQILALLPEYILTVAGILLMLVEAMLKPGASRKPLGWLAILATALSGIASYAQLHQGVLTAFSNTVQVDSFSVFFHLLIAAILIVTLLASLDYFGSHASHEGEYYALLLFGAVGMMLMSCSLDLLMVFIGLEISSISTYIMAGFRKSRAAASESSIKYFLLGSFATAFFLYGIALAFGATGSTSIPAIAAGLGSSATPTLAFLALALMIVGLGFKVSAAPFHVWTPDVYQGAPAPVVGFMSTAPKAAAFAVLLRILFSGFPTMQHRWSLLLWAVAALSMTIGNLGALKQADVKRMLAYSSIAHAGYLLAAFTALAPAGIAAACFYTASYAAMNVGAFIVITQVSGFNEDLRTVEDYRGLAASHPLLSAMLAVFLLSLIGIPFTGGFFGKFYVFTAVIGAGRTGLAVVGLLNSGVACFYYLRLLASIYSKRQGPASEQSARVTSISAATAPSISGATAAPDSTATGVPFAIAVRTPAAIALFLTAAATLLLGIWPDRIVHLSDSAASSLSSTTQAAAIPSTAPASSPEQSAARRQ